MMRSTKIKIAIGLGLTSAAALGLLVISSPVEADNIPLKINADDSFSGKTLQLLADDYVKQNYSPPTETSYNRTSGKIYQMKVKGGSYNCEFINGDIAGDDVIPENVSEIYLKYENNYCAMDTKPFVTEPGEEPPVGGPVNLDLNIYAKGIDNPGVKLWVEEFTNSNAVNPIQTKSYDVVNAADQPVLQEHIPPSQNYDYSKIRVALSGADVICNLAGKTVKKGISALNVVVDAQQHTCQLSPVSTTVKLTVSAESTDTSPPGTHTFAYSIPKGTGGNSWCALHSDTAVKINAGIGGTEELTILHPTGIDCVNEEIYPVLFQWGNYHRGCTLENNNSYIPADTVSISIEAKFMSDGVKSTCKMFIE